MTAEPARGGQPGKICQLCELPKAQCVHGVERRRARAQRRNAAKAVQSKAVGAVRGRQAKPVLGKAEFGRLTRDVAQTRTGYALNLEATEAGICAIGRVVRDRDGVAIAAVTISAPTVRFPAERIDRLAKALAETTVRAGHDLPSGLG